MTPGTVVVYVARRYHYTDGDYRVWDLRGTPPHRRRTNAGDIVEGGVFVVQCEADAQWYIIVGGDMRQLHLRAQQFPDEATAMAALHLGFTP